MKKYLYLLLIPLLLAAGCSTKQGPSLADRSAMVEAVELDTNSDGAIDITRGGTGGTTAGDARTALGVPATADMQTMSEIGTDLVTAADAAAARALLEITASGVTVQANDPTTASAEGLYGATTSGDFFFRASAGIFNISAGTYTLDPVPPTIGTWAIGTNGTTVTATLSESCVEGASFADGTWTMDCTVTGPLDMGDPTGLPGTDLTWTMAGGPVLSTATDTECLVYHTNGTNIIEDATGDDLAGWSTGVVVTNNSTEIASLEYTPGPNEVVCLVDTDTGNAAADYHSLEAAINGEKGGSPVCATGTDLVTNTEQLTFLLKASTGVADTQSAQIDLSTFTTNSTYFVRIITHPEHRHAGVWNTNKYRFTALDSASHNFNVTINYVVIDSLQFTKTSSYSNRNLIRFEPASSTGQQIVRNNIFKASLTNTGHNAISFTTSNGRGVVYNNIFIDWLYNSSGTGLVGTGGSATHYFYSNTFDGNNIGMSAAAGTVYAKNNISVNSTTADYAGTFASGTSNNISEDATAPGTSATTGAVPSDLFTDVGNDDFSLKTGSAAIEAGATLGSPYNVDIIGTARPQSTNYDAGAFEKL